MSNWYYYQTVLLLFVLAAPFHTAMGQTRLLPTGEQTQSVEQLETEKALFRVHRSLAQNAASRWFDVTYYRLELTVTTTASYLRGRVTIVGICTSDSADQLTLDLENQMRIDSVWAGSVRIAYRQNASSFDATLDRTYRRGDPIFLDVFYGGNPLPTGFGSFMFGSHLGVPWVWSLSQPYGARDWWPCKDDPSDKADSADIIVTCDSTLRVGSQGILLSAINLGDGRTRFHWRERYPIASYLISIALTNYTEFSNWFRYSESDSMEILNYVLPEDSVAALASLPRTVDMLSIYSNLFGLYPFIQEKYGHAEFGSGGAMEHQTMTSTTTFNEDVISHELAHQWFGDMITCRTWSDLWLNEGFAQYSSALYREKKYGMDSYWVYMQSQLSRGIVAKGIIGIADTSSVRNLFDPARIYSKGASVLHMLRHVLGDSVFFRCLKMYANQPSLKYATASIRDFQSVCESVAGRDLNFFFQEWIYGENFPQYILSWSSKPSGNAAVLTIDLKQLIGTANTAYFTMPVDIRISGTGWDTTVTVFNDSLMQRFTFNVPGNPAVVLIDPDGWIMKQVFSEPPSQFSLEQNYPNPFNVGTTIRYTVSEKSRVKMKVFNVLGQEVADLVDEVQSAGSYQVRFEGKGLPTGVYFCRLVAGSNVNVKKMVLIR